MQSDVNYVGWVNSYVWGPEAHNGVPHRTLAGAIVLQRRKESAVVRVAPSVAMLFKLRGAPTEVSYAS